MSDNETMVEIYLPNYGQTPDDAVPIIVKEYVREAIQNFIDKRNRENADHGDEVAMVREMGGEWERWEIKCVRVVYYDATKKKRKPR